MKMRAWYSPPPAATRPREFFAAGPRRRSASLPHGNVTRAPHSTPRRASAAQNRGGKLTATGGWDQFIDVDAGTIVHRSGDSEATANDAATNRQCWKL